MNHDDVTVLVVDDDDDLAELLRFILTKDGFVVHVLHHPRDAETVAAEIDADIVILDIRMPGRDGRDVARALRADDTTADLGIILLSALSDDVWDGWQSGADSYVTKPFEPDVLRREITRVLEVRSHSTNTNRPTDPANPSRP